MRYFLFALVCYLIGTAAIAWMLWYMQFQLDDAVEPFSAGAVLWNLLLFMVFPLQHSLLVRTWWKGWIQRRIHPLMERPVYVGTSGIALALVIGLWKPFGPVLFHFERRIPFDIVFFLSLASILWSAAAIDHSLLFGLKHGIAAWKGTTLADTGLQKRGPFAYIRHPLTTFLILAIWSHHTLNAGRLEWNLLFTAYSLIGVIFEERDLIKKLGEQYRQYCREVPAFIPSPRSWIEKRR